jgi:hypothetical protein
MHSVSRPSVGVNIMKLAPGAPLGGGLSPLPSALRTPPPRSSELDGAAVLTEQSLQLVLLPAQLKQRGQSSRRPWLAS